MALELRDNRVRKVYVGATLPDGVCFDRQLDTGEELTGTPDVTIEAGGQVTLVTSSEGITTTNQTNDTAGAKFTAVSAGRVTITIACDTTLGATLVDYIEWDVRAIPDN